jgi:hypothetical protein
MIAKVSMLVAGAAIGLAAAAYGGMRYGKGVVLDDCMHQASRDVERLVATLKHVRADERDPVNKALQDAKAYRAAHPRKSSRPQLDARIAELLSRGSYKQ